MVKVTGNENVKSRFSRCVLQQWIDLRQAETKITGGPLYTYPCRFVYITPAEMIVFVIICSLLVQEGCMSHLAVYLLVS